MWKGMKPLFCEVCGPLCHTSPSRQIFPSSSRKHWSALSCWRTSLREEISTLRPTVSVDWPSNGGCEKTNSSMSSMIAESPTSKCSGERRCLALSAIKPGAESLYERLDRKTWCYWGRCSHAAAIASIERFGHMDHGGEESWVPGGLDG